ncbi:intradiol ring-cleavage dioxygenase [Metapseudomonas boanensis]|uniref:Intradiol ring-cleavage dioxygenase n=1 Tax=Metapseudomonas boanensis TaxID=2822138 RepID=A0ABS5XNF0_9GAMM|nr:intradiol ring-cleavage dioxygenase [Pseudomonas boanensis]MBT8769226.1 intradiol ring-cleavage dioxygenase [Pseudomonas boanensis]
MNNIPPNEAKISFQAVASFANTPDPRLRQIIQSLVRHLHAFASEVELTEEEWLHGIRFLTDTGKMCDGVVRQEFILLSDVIGLSMLVDAINHRASENVTETTVFGPFYMTGMPERGHGENMALTPGQPALVQGRVLDAQGEPISGAVLDVWQTAENGMYSGQDPAQPLANLRGRYRTDDQGRFAIRTILPVSYPIPTDGPVGRLLQASNRHAWRPAHLHFMVMAERHRTLVTHLFNHDDPYLESDVVFGVKDSLKVVYEPCQADHPLAARYDFTGSFSLASYDFVLGHA